MRRFFFSPTLWILIVGLLGGMLAGCGPHLIVRQLDRSHPRVDISVDGRRVGTVAFGETLKVALERGPRRIQAQVSGSDERPWSAPDDFWSVVVENDVFLSLLPPLPDLDAAPQDLRHTPAHDPGGGL